MKNLVVMIGAALGLFVATVLGLLGAQGRLSWEGTKGVPLLHSLFEPPPAHTEAGKPSGDAHGEATPAAHAGDADKEEKRRYRVGPGIGDPDTTGPKKLETPAGENGDARPHPPGADEKAGHDPHAADSQFRDKTEAALGSSDYTRGKLFDFPRIKARLSVEDMNRILDQAKAEKEAGQHERAVLAQRKTELDARESDLRDRELRILEQMRGIEQARTQLNERIEAFRDQVILVEKQEAVDLQTDAATLAAFEPQRASALLLEWWKRTAADQVKVVKVLSVMEADAANAILQVMEVSQAREILDKRALVIRVDQSGKK
jgi:hypothetical protein